MAAVPTREGYGSLVRKTWVLPLTRTLFTDVTVALLFFFLFYCLLI